MSTDIHWVLERQHQDGTWHAVCSRSSIRQLQINSPDRFSHDDHDTPAEVLGRRDYRVFDALSGRQMSSLDVLRQIAVPDYPADASRHGYLELSPEEDIHTVGYFLHTQLQDFCAGKIGNIFSTETGDRCPSRIVKSLRQRSDAIADLLRDSHISSKICVGPAWGDRLEHFPEMENQSNHEKLKLKEMFDTLLPVSGKTVRVLVGYDN